MPRSEQSPAAQPPGRGRRGMRLGRTAAFAAVSLITPAAVYLFGDKPQALIAAVTIGVLAGLLIAIAISHRVVSLARAAGEMAGGSFDAPLNVSGPDEIGDLARALDSMRASLKESFGVLTADRNKLAAIFDGLTDVVMVVDYEGPVRFSNSAASRLLDSSGQPPEPALSQLHRASEVGFSAHPALRIGDRAYAMTARALPDERAVLAVLRDRTDEMRQELAEADFVSNAAHELRNPLAGISSAIEVLQSGAKDDPGDRDHFLKRLGEDAERMNRLTQSLLTLLRQVMIGLLTNAYKNTPPPGTVTVRGRHDSEGEVILEVIDTGTGIPAAELERVFERFYRRSESRKQEGFGLGLARSEEHTSELQS